jgi:hypothetical protein
MTSRDSGEEVRWRIDTWNANVERAQRITIFNCQMIRRRYKVVIHTEEDILEDYGLL